MTMTPEQKYREWMWGILQNWKLEELKLPTGKKFYDGVFTDLSKQLQEQGLVRLTEFRPNKNGMVYGYYIDFVRPQYDEFYKALETEFGYDADEPTGEVVFNDEEAALIYGKKRAALPPFKKEHLFCQAAYDYPINEVIDWSDIYEKMRNVESENTDDWRYVYDALNSVNRRASKMFGIKQLFEWKQQTVKRLR